MPPKTHPAGVLGGLRRSVPAGGKATTRFLAPIYFWRVSGEADGSLCGTLRGHEIQEAAHAAKEELMSRYYKTLSFAAADVCSLYASFT